MTGGITIRRAVPPDASLVAVLSGTLGYPAEAAVIMRRLERLSSRADNIVLVAEAASGRVVGWLHGVEEELLESGGRCEILGLVVDPEFRGGGIGRRLVTAAADWAASRGLAELTVRSNVVRVESHPFYERLGFDRVKTQHAYCKPISRPKSA